MKEIQTSLEKVQFSSMDRIKTYRLGQARNGLKITGKEEGKPLECRWFASNRQPIGENWGWELFRAKMSYLRAAEGAGSAGVSWGTSGPNKGIGGMPLDRKTSDVVWLRSLHALIQAGGTCCWQAFKCEHRQKTYRASISVSRGKWKCYC